MNIVGSFLKYIGFSIVIAVIIIVNLFFFENSNSSEISLIAANSEKSLTLLGIFLLGVLMYCGGKIMEQHN